MLNLRPPPVSIVPTWDVGRAFSFLVEWHPSTDISLDRLTKKVVFLSALCTTKRVGDLVFFSADERLCSVVHQVYCSRQGSGLRQTGPLTDPQ